MRDMVLTYVHVLMRYEKEERKQQARSNKQTKQSNTAHPTCMVVVVVAYRTLTRPLVGIVSSSCGDDEKRFRSEVVLSGPDSSTAGRVYPLSTCSKC